eukprot:6399714-Ditylum_brightwellii.AAC.1
MYNQIGYLPAVVGSQTGNDDNNIPDNYQILPKVRIHKDDIFPFLNLEMYWNKEGKLEFRAYRKSN